MGDNSNIEWTDATWNPVRGCALVSHGCTNCYAMRQAHRTHGPGGAYEGLTKMTSHGPVWTGAVRLVPDLLDRPLRWRRPRRIFVNSMSDLFHDDVPDEFIDDVFVVMAMAAQHSYQVLTKRPQRMFDYLNSQDEHWDDHRLEILRSTALMGGYTDRPEADIRWPLPNVWLGVSVEDQRSADERIPLLLQTPAAVRFLSCEPLLGPIVCGEALCPTYSACQMGDATRERLVDLVKKHAREVGWTGLDWVIAGGESGPSARPSHPDWFRSLRDQCQAAGVKFFMKQITERGRKVPFEQWPDDLKIREYPNAGRTWEEYPMSVKEACERQR